MARAITDHPDVLAEPLLTALGDDLLDVIRAAVRAARGGSNGQG
jgi:hypothetical protein